MSNFLEYQKDDNFEENEPIFIGEPDYLCGKREGYILLVNNEKLIIPNDTYILNNDFVSKLVKSSD